MNLITYNDLFFSCLRFSNNSDLLFFYFILLFKEISLHYIPCNNNEINSAYIYFLLLFYSMIFSSSVNKIKNEELNKKNPKNRLFFIYFHVRSPLLLHSSSSPLLCISYIIICFYLRRKRDFFSFNINYIKFFIYFLSFFVICFDFSA